MMDRFCKLYVRKRVTFGAGFLFGTGGIKILSSKDAKKVYVSCTAAALRAKECIMRTVSVIQENAEDIYEEALEVNEKRAAEETEFEDESEAHDDFQEAPVSEV